MYIQKQHTWSIFSLRYRIPGKIIINYFNIFQNIVTKSALHTEISIYRRNGWYGGSYPINVGAGQYSKADYLFLLSWRTSHWC
jgi:hypothetical protein